MKSYEEMIQNILDARDAYDQKKQRQKQLARRYIPIVSSFCFVVLIGFGVWNRQEQIPAVHPDTTEPPTIPTDTSEPATQHSPEILSTTEKFIDTTENFYIPTETESAMTEQTDSPESESTSIVTVPESSIITETISLEPVPVETDWTEITVLLETEPFEAITEQTLTEPIQTTEHPIMTETTSSQKTDTPETTEIPDEETSTNPETSLSWEEMTINQQYNMAEFSEPVRWYMNTNRTISAEQTGEWLGSAYMDGYDSNSDTYYHCNTAVYAVQGFSEWEVIAVRFEECPDFFIYLDISLDKNKQKEILSALA